MAAKKTKDKKSNQTNLLLVVLIVLGLVGLIYAVVNSTNKSGGKQMSNQETKTLHYNCKKYNFSSEEDFLPKYVVKKGDTLLSVAKKQLGDNSRIGELIELNKKLYPGLSIDEPFIEQNWTLYLPPQGVGKTNGKLFEVNGELSINPQDGRWGVNFTNGGAGAFRVDKVVSANESFKEGDCVKVLYEGETLRVFSASHQ